MRKYQSISLTQRGQGSPKKFGDRIIAPPDGMHWIWSQENIDKAMAEGIITFTENDFPRYKKYFDEWDGTISFDKKPCRIKVRNIAGDETTISV